MEESALTSEQVVVVDANGVALPMQGAAVGMLEVVPPQDRCPPFKVKSKARKMEDHEHWKLARHLTEKALIAWNARHVPSLQSKASEHNSKKSKDAEDFFRNLTRKYNLLTSGKNFAAEADDILSSGKDIANFQDFAFLKHVKLSHSEQDAVDEESRWRQSTLHDEESLNLWR